MALTAQDYPPVLPTVTLPQITMVTFREQMTPALIRHSDIAPPAAAHWQAGWPPPEPPAC